MPVIGYILDLAAAAFAVSCGTMWMTLKCHSLAFGPETALFIARVARGHSFIAACSLVGFFATGIVRVSFATRPEGGEELTLLLMVCAGLLVWFGLGRMMRKLKMGKK
jgi:hypothetical protein